MAATTRSGTEGLRFFPLFPLLARMVGWVPGVDSTFAVVLVANISALALGFVIYRLAYLERGDERFARRSVWLCYLLPPAFVLVMGYAEATFMLLASVVLYASRTSRWWVAAVAGFLAGGCRPIGVLLFVPVVIEAVRDRRSLTGWDIAGRVAAVMAPAAGCFAYLSWAADRTDSFLEPLRLQQNPQLRGSTRFPFTNVVDVARDFATGDQDTAGLHLITVAVCLALLVVLARRWPASYTMYAAASLIARADGEQPGLDGALHVVDGAVRVRPRGRARHRGAGTDRVGGRGCGHGCGIRARVLRVARPVTSRVKFGHGLLLIALVAFGIRVGYVAFAKADDCAVRIDGEVVATYPSECAVGDQIYYNASANVLADGEGFTEPLWPVTHPGEDPPPAADHPPLTTLVLAPVSFFVERPPLEWIAGDALDTNLREHRYAMAVLGTGVVVLIGLLGRRVRDDRVGLVAAGIAAVSPNLWVNDGLVMSETIMNLAVVGALLAAVIAFERPSPKRLLVLGVCCGLATLARAELLMLVPLLDAAARVAVASATPRVGGRNRRQPARHRPVGRVQPRPLRRAHVPLDQRRHRARRLELRPGVLGQRDRALGPRRATSCPVDAGPGDQSVVAGRYRDRARRLRAGSLAPGSRPSCSPASAAHGACSARST